MDQLWVGVEKRDDAFSDDIFKLLLPECRIQQQRDFPFFSAQTRPAGLFNRLSHFP